MRNSNLLAVAKEALTLIGTASILVLYWGYIAVQDPIRSQFGGTLPFSPQDYYAAGVEQLGTIGPVTAVGFVLGLLTQNRSAKAPISQWSLLRHSLGSLLGALMLSSVLAMVKPAGLWAFGLAYLSTTLISYSAGWMAGIILGWLNSEVELQQNINKLDERRRETRLQIDGLITKLQTQPRDDLTSLLSLARIKELIELADEAKDVQKEVALVVKRSTFTWTGWFLTTIVLLMMYVSLSTDLVKANTHMATQSTRYHEVVVTTKTMVSELASVNPVSNSYRLRLVARADNQLFLIDPDSHRVLVLPLSEVLRVTYTSVQP